jgi:hypothetical protein
MDFCQSYADQMQQPMVVIWPQIRQKNGKNFIHFIDNWAYSSDIPPQASLHFPPMYIVKHFLAFYATAYHSEWCKRNRWTGSTK